MITCYFPCTFELQEHCVLPEHLSHFLLWCHSHGCETEDEGFTLLHSSGNPECRGSFCIAWLWRPLRGRSTVWDSKLCQLALNWEPSFTSPLTSCCLLATRPCGLTQADLWLAFLLPQPLFSEFMGHQAWQPAPLPTEPYLWPWNRTFLIYVWTNYTKETFKLSKIFIF